MLWRQSKHKQSLRKDVQIWEKKYSEMMTISTAGVVGAGYQSLQQLHGWIPDWLDGQPRLPPQIKGWVPTEIDGRHIKEMVVRAGPV